MVFLELLPQPPPQHLLYLIRPTLMPRKPSLVRQRCHYSQDLKHRVIYQAHTLGKTSTAIALDLDMPLRVVQRVKRTWFEIGEVCRKGFAVGRRPLMSPAHTKVSTIVLPCVQSIFSSTLQFMLALIEHSPDIYLDEIQESLLEQHDINVSLPSISRTLKRLGMSSKKVSSEKPSIMSLNMRSAV